jgi:hypothetical protein
MVIKLIQPWLHSMNRDVYPCGIELHMRRFGSWEYASVTPYLTGRDPYDKIMN